MNAVAEKKFQVIEKDQDAQRKILSGLVDTPAQGIAYMLMMVGQPVSVDDIVGFLRLSDSWCVERFDSALTELEASGLIRKMDSGACPAACLETALQEAGTWPDSMHFCSASAW